MEHRISEYKTVPLDIAGYSDFGRYPKISKSETFNMFVSDNFLVPYAGYESVYSFHDTDYGRGIFNSTRFGKLIFVIGNGVFTYDKLGQGQKLAEIDTGIGDVFISENDKNQIAICDKKNLYIYNYSTSLFSKVTTGFDVGYIEFQDGYFIAANANNPQWRLSALNDGTNWPLGANNEGSFQTKSDNVQACIRVPGRGNQLFVMGSNVTEPWSNVGYQLFPYQRSSGYNIDYGCVNPATIAVSDTFVIWIGKNEKSGLAIMYSSGGDVTQVSTDGINYKLSNVKYPEECFGFLFKQDGHLFYQFTFYNSEDNFTLAYDFSVGKFITLSDTKFNCHIAKRVAFFNNEYYFVSFNNGSLYKMDSTLTTYDGKEIPRVRVCSPKRKSDQNNFIVRSVGFTIEQGTTIDSLPYTEPMVDKGVINSSSDFPYLVPPGLGTYNLVKVGDMYTIETTCFDNDVLRTNTGESFLKGTQIVWNRIGWDRIIPNLPCVDLSISYDGGESFGNSQRVELNEVGRRKNKLLWRNLGMGNDFAFQFRFWGLGRFVATTGEVNTRT